MSEKIKKIIYAALFILLTLLLGYFLYLFFFKTSAPTQTPTNLNALNYAGGLPQAGTNTNQPTYINTNGQLVPATNVNASAAGVSSVARGGLTQVTSLTTTAAQGFTLAKDGSGAIYYNRTEGKFYKIGADGQTTLLTDKIFHDVEDIYWSPDTEKAVLEYPDGSNIVYDFKSKKQYTLPKHWEDFSFSPKSDQLVFKSMALDEENRWLAISKPDGSGVQALETLGDNADKVYIDWSPNKQIIATNTESIDFDRQYLYFVGTQHENFRSTIIEGWDYRSEWSTNGDRLLYSVWNQDSDLKPNIWIVNGYGENIGTNRTNLNLQTWADKCTFSDNSTVYCAVPQYLPRGAGIEPDIAASTPDDFYKIDLKTNTKSLIAVPDGTYTAKDLSVSSDGKYLYFIDGVTGRLNKIGLK
ncbi:MAG: hypothetical protein WC480_02045 [Patescibacteria group bacterium]